MILVQIKAEGKPGTGTVRLYVAEGLAVEKIVKVVTPQELYAEYKLFKYDLVEKAGVNVDVVVPNLYREFCLCRVPPPQLAQPNQLPADHEYFCTVCGKKFADDAPGTRIKDGHAAHEDCYDSHVAFQTNMVECLEGWKAWTLKDYGGSQGWLLTSANDFIWHPDTRAESLCNKTTHHSVVHNNCSCGFYAADNNVLTRSYHQGGARVEGKIYGWGRYLRADSGWRSQYAYPKEFIIEPHQMGIVEHLKKYHVPIYVMEPLRIYDPSEDGYTTGGSYGDRNGEEDRDGGTASGADTDQA